eukprot:TRINITY_DN518_c2_g2_i2.p1 TRINITY_DN518_c2_g2~~TRINITY_DN518_c2_g2_i2.p1  ORF type:complete len:194 (-),score=41.69 TRINITY_DN518_c2_g2_i2:87-668(-)
MFRDEEDPIEDVATNRKTFNEVNSESPPVVDRGSGCLVFSGVLNLDIPKKGIERSGFACIMSPVYNSFLDLSLYNALELRIKSDGRVYVAQIKTQSPLDDDLFQIIIPPVVPNEWVRVVLPFNEFLLTWRGYAEEEQQRLRPDRIKHIAILMAERKDGPFEFQIDYIQAIKIDKNTYIGSDKKRFSTDEAYEI